MQIVPTTLFYCLDFLLYDFTLFIAAGLGLFPVIAAALGPSSLSNPHGSAPKPVLAAVIYAFIQINRILFLTPCVFKYHFAQN